MDNTILITTSSFGKYDNQPLDKLKEAGYTIHFNPFKRKLNEEEICQLITKIQPTGLIAGVEPLTRHVLKAAKYLKIISRCGIGMDSVDLVAAKDLRITVVNTPDAPTIPVAELTMGLILGLLRKIHISDYSIRKGLWTRPMGNLLYGKTVGIIGCGRIGNCLANFLKPFGCCIYGYDPAYDEAENFTMVQLDRLLSESDIVSLHIPGSEDNHHMISSHNIKFMKTGAILINASRGGLINEDVLYEALKSGKLAGAAMDVYEDEPYKGPLTELDNVLLTAHIGSYAIEGRVMMEMQAVENLLRQIEGKTN